MTIADDIVREIVRLFPETLRYTTGRARWMASATLPAVKTLEHYTRQIKALVNRLFDGTISESEFVDGMADIIPAQLTRAWHEGMYENGLMPDEMIPEWQDALDALILSEYDHVDQFAADVAENARSEMPNVDPFLSRAEVWANRYTDVKNEAVIVTAKGSTKLKWKLGATEEHCNQCAALNGIIAFSSEWQQAGLRPQQPPNDKLECGGWRCDCTLTETTERRTTRALDRLLNIAQGVV